MSDQISGDDSTSEPTNSRLLEIVEEQHQRIAKLESKRRLPGKRTLAILLSGVLAISLGGVASASIPDSSNIIHGCYATTGTHTLRVIDTSASSACPSGTTALNWSGAYTGYSATVKGGSEKSMTASGWVSVVKTLGVKAGNYLVTATTDASPDSYRNPNPDSIGCAVAGNAGPTSSTYSNAVYNGVANNVASYPLAVTGYVHTTGSNVIHLWCRSSYGDTGSYVSGGSLTAVPVASVSVTSNFGAPPPSRPNSRVH